MPLDVRRAPAGGSDEILLRLSALHPKKIDLSLGRIAALLDKLGRPQDRLPPVIHVGGTNGKGSTVAFMRAMLEAAGKRVHVYTSPHLVRFHERIRLGAPGGGQLVDEAELARTLAACEQVNAGEPITFFEMTTAAAFVLFAEHPADMLLLEVGLGGRFDATNMIVPAASVVTPVSMDHVEFLGNTIEADRLREGGDLQARRAGHHRIAGCRRSGGAGARGGARRRARAGRRPGLPLARGARPLRLRGRATACSTCRCRASSAAISTSNAASAIADAAPGLAGPSRRGLRAGARCRSSGRRGCSLSPRAH